VIEPRAPTSWPEYRIEYRYGKSVYVINVRNEAGVGGGAVEIEVDGRRSEDGRIRLVDDGDRHEVTVTRIPTVHPAAPAYGEEEAGSALI
jgi:cyclic beta-1,2-glucan synthetase